MEDVETVASVQAITDTDSSALKGKEESIRLAERILWAIDSHYRF